MRRQVRVTVIRLHFSGFFPLLTFQSKNNAYVSSASLSMHMDMTDFWSAGLIQMNALVVILMEISFL